MTARLALILGSVAGFLAVATGAFGAHGLQGKISAKRLANWETASDYAIAHALALVAVGLLLTQAPSRSARVSAWGFTAGIALFSGSLWVLAVTDISKLGMITPFGGLAFLVGWVALALAARHIRPSEGETP